MLCMSTMTNEGNIPTWDRPDRLGKALRHAGVGVGEMAEYLGISRNTVGNYTSGRTSADKRTLRLWALRTGVPLEWLETGATTGSTPPGGPASSTRGYLPHHTLSGARLLAAA